MKFIALITYASLVSGLPGVFHHQNEYSNNNNYNNEINVPSYNKESGEPKHKEGVFATNQDCIDNDQLRVFGLKFDFLPGIAYNQGIDLNRGCGSLFNVNAINDIIREGGETLSHMFNPLSLFKRDLRDEGHDV